MNKLIYFFLTTVLCAFALPDFVYAVGENNPGGVTAPFNGEVMTAGSYDPLTGNAKRTVVDINLEGAIGAYPLTWTRTFNTRGRGTAFAGGWSHS